MARIIYRLSTGQSVADWCRENNVPYGTFTASLNKGLSIDETCELAKKARERGLNFKPVMYKGKSLMSQFPSGYVSIMSHIRKKGCTPEEAVKLYKFNLKNPYTPKNISPVINVKTGRKWSSIKECAKTYKVSTTTIIRRLRKNKELKYLEKNDGF